jgi:hypothetical protein
MQAENATKASPLSLGEPEPEAFDEPEPLVLPVVPICATFPLGEPPPHAAASIDSPATATSASPRNAGRSRREHLPAVCSLRSTIAISSPSQLTDLRV